MTKVAITAGETANISKYLKNVTHMCIFPEANYFSQILCQFQVFSIIPAPFMADGRVWDVLTCPQQRTGSKKAL